jgi:hypothetical protein
MTRGQRDGAGPAAAPAGPMTEFRALYERLRGQAPWGPDDRRGALNYITWSFLCVIAPLRLPAGAGSPVSPVAIM